MSTTDAATSGEPGSGAVPTGAELTADSSGEAVQPAASSPDQVVIPENWKQALPEDLQADPTIANLSGVTDMAKMLVHTQKMVGARAENTIQIPESAEDAEGWNKVYTRLGKPESADAYEIPTVEGLPVDENFTGAMRQAFHENNLTAAQASALAAKYQEFGAEQMKAKKDEAIATATAEIDGLKKEWGAGYDAKVELAKRAAKAFDPTGAVLDRMESDNVLGRAGIYKLMATIGGKITPDGGPGPGKEGGGFELTPAEARGKIESLKANKDFMDAYKDKNHPLHKQKVDEMLNLQIAVAGGS